MRVSAQHGTTRQRARETVTEELPRLLARFGGQVSNPRYSWTGDTLEFSFRAAGADLQGILHVNDRDIEIEVGDTAPVPPLPGEDRARDAGVVRPRIQPNEIKRLTQEHAGTIVRSSFVLSLSKSLP